MIEIAIDIGGTFTDVVAVRDGHDLFSAKVPSTPADLSSGVREGLHRVLKTSGGQPGDVSRFIHGTTVATNAVLERKGAITAVLTTAGFEDVLEIGRLKRSRMYDIFMDAETPVFIAPRRRRYGIRERIDSRGRILVELDEAGVRAAVEEASSVHGVQSVAVCYLFSFLNPIHEQRTREIISGALPNVRVSLSSDISPVFREYERTVVTAFDAYVRPRMEDYLRRLQTELASFGIQVTLQVMQSRGGISSIDNTLAKPVTTLLSGPAGGVIGGKFAGQRSGYENLVTLDMGGTSCDVALVEAGRTLVTTEAKIGTYPLHIPMVDVSTIGAGGGSIARVDPLGGLRVGPDSAGAEPGPACYGRGGSLPTVTDASLVLGYLNPDYFAGGELKLDKAAASEAVGRVAGELSLNASEMALGIHRVINSQMADQIRLISVRRGCDLRDFALVLLGGAGPLHGGVLAEALAIPTMIVPERPGVLSAFGLMVARIEHDHSRSFVTPASDVDLSEMAAVFGELDRLGQERMKQEGVPGNGVQVFRSADMRYVGQSFELEVPLATEISTETTAQLVRDFHALHQLTHSHSTPGNAVEIVNLRVVHSFQLPHPDPSQRASIQSPAATTAPRESRLAAFTGFPKGTRTPVYDRGQLSVGSHISGPAIIEQPDTTTVVYPGHQCRMDDSGNLVITISNSQERPSGHGEIELATDGIDNITLEVLRNRLDVIAEEMQGTLARSAHSPNIKEAIDASAAIFDTAAGTIAQANAHPIHLGSLDPVVRRLCEAFRPDEMRDGDIFIMNDPYEGGQHIPDVVVLAPVIFDGETVALTCSMAHHQDMGGKSPGSTPTDSTEIYQEGLIIPPLRLFDEGRPNETLMALIRKNVRIPHIVLGDLSAQVAAANTGRSRLLALFDQYGVVSMLRYVDELQKRSEAMTRYQISQMPDGDYSFTDYLDNDGIELDRRIRLSATVSIRGSDFVVDFAGSDPQVRGPFNAVPSVALSAVRYVVRVVTDPDIPNNAGCYRPITVIVPPDSVVNPRHPAPVNSRAVTLRRMIEVVMGALVQAIPERVTAANNGHPLLCLIGGNRPETREQWVTTLGATGGMGGRPGKDGAETIQTDASNAMNIPAEAIETLFPLRVLRWALRDDSGGPGRWRGGNGLEYFIEVVGSEIHVSHRGERHYTSPWGLFGGLAGARSRTDILQPDGTVRQIPSKQEFVLGKGGQMRFYTTGGGGYGDPFDRSPELVVADVIDRKVSPHLAATAYGVAIRGDSVPTVDWDATKRLRADLRRSRGPVTWTYDRGDDGRE